jgi:hypothetical protein
LFRNPVRGEKPLKENRDEKLWGWYQKNKRGTVLQLILTDREWHSVFELLHIRDKAASTPYLNEVSSGHRHRHVLEHAM